MPSLMLGIRFTKLTLIKRNLCHNDSYFHAGFSEVIYADTETSADTFF